MIQTFKQLKPSGNRNFPYTSSDLTIKTEQIDSVGRVADSDDKCFIVVNGYEYLLSHSYDELHAIFNPTPINNVIEADHVPQPTIDVTKEKISKKK